MKEYHKLVRDKIPEIIKNNDSIPVRHIAWEQEYKDALVKKLEEEVTEFLETPSVEEAADVLEVMRAICLLQNINIDNLEQVRLKKSIERGGFGAKIILEKVE